MKKIALPLVISLMLVAGVWLLPGFFLKREKLCYVNNEQLFNEFGMKLELEGQLRKAELSGKARLDSLKMDLDRLDRGLRSMTKPTKEMAVHYEQLVGEIQYLESDLLHQNEELAAKMNTQIWNQLNQYIKEFAEEHQIDILFGTTAQGNLMFAASGYDVTLEAVRFVNERYKGQP